MGVWKGKSTLDPRKEFPGWPKGPAWQRVLDCKTVLIAHGFLSEAENDKVSQRIAQWLADDQSQQEQPL